MLCHVPRTQGLTLASKLLVVHAVNQINVAFCRQHSLQCNLSEVWRSACSQVRAAAPLLVLD